VRKKINQVKGALVTLTALELLRTGRKNHLNASIPKSKQGFNQALVLGSGGMLGAAWIASSLNFLESKNLWKQENDDLRIGTSAGSLIASLLGGGLNPSELIKILSTGRFHNEGSEINLPSVPSREKIPFGPSDSSYLLRSLLKGRAPHLGILVASLFPEGEQSTSQVEEFVNMVVNNKWSSTTTWIVATEVSSGKRKIFTDKSGVNPGQAVAASCAVPALYLPVTINSKKYIDGGAISCHNLDVAVSSGAKNITLLSPISGYTKINFKSGINRALNQFTRNTEQFSMDQIVRKLPLDINLRVISPGKESRKILSSSSLMNSEKLSELLVVAANEVPEIKEVF